MKKNLIGFTTSDGRKHLGYHTPVVNLCADYWEPDSIVSLYKDESGQEYRDVIEEFPVDEITCNYWDEEKGCYQLLPPPRPTTLAERTAGLFAKDLVTEDRGVLLAYLRMIREWLILNTKCSMPIYIDKGFVIQSEGTIIINEDSAKHMPEYIHINNNRKKS